MKGKFILSITFLMLVFIVFLFGINKVNASDQIIQGNGKTSVTLNVLQPVNLIILSQDYIDSYLDWNFTQINRTTWKANFTIDKTFFNDTKICLLKSGQNRIDCFTDLCGNYFNLTLNCTADNGKLNIDLSNMTNYPLRNLSADIGFSSFVFNSIIGKGSFNINLPFTFSSDLLIKFGFNSTITLVPTSGKHYTASGTLTENTHTSTAETELSSACYTNVSASDDTRCTQTGSVSLDAYFLTNFSLPQGNYTNGYIEITAEFRTTSANDACHLAIYNFTGATWTDMNTTASGCSSTSDTTLFVNLSGKNLNDFTNLTSLKLRVMPHGAGGSNDGIAVDLIKAVVTFDPTINLSYVSPTDNASVTITDRNFTYINLSVTNASLVDEFKIEWNGTNITAWGAQRLVALWNLNNNTLDYSGNGRNMLIVDANCTDNVAGRFLTGCRLNGRVAAVLNATANIVKQKNMTYMLWLNKQGAGDASGIQAIMVNIQNHAAFNGIQWLIEANDTMRWEYWQGDINRGKFTPPQNISDKQWHHVAFTWTGDARANGVNLYIDGALVGQGATTVADNGARQFVDLFGMRSDTPGSTDDYPFNGTFDEIRVYNYSLTAAEINATFKSEIGKFYMNITDQQNGTYSYNAWINNTANDINNSGSRTITFGTATADSVPTMIIDAPTNSSFTTANRTLNFRAGDDLGVSQCKYSLNNGVNTSIISCGNTTLDTGANGSFILRVYVNDTTNQSTNANVNFSVNVATNSCTPTANQQWDLILSDNCSISGLNITITKWVINTTGNGLTNISFSNISYENRTFGMASGLGQLVLFGDGTLRVKRPSD